MSQKELLIYLISYYKNHLLVVRGMNDLYSVRKYLIDNKLQFGVCFCAHRVFNVFIYMESWVKANLNHLFNRYWDITPDDCDNVEDVYRSMENRIIIMENILEDID